MIKLGIVYGGVSTEHDISVMSAKSVIENLDKEKYEIHEIYINKYGKWYEVIDDEKEEIYNLIWTLKKLDVVFPVLHGLGGEDGTPGDGTKTTRDYGTPGYSEITIDLTNLYKMMELKMYV